MIEARWFVAGAVGIACLASSCAEKSAARSAPPTSPIGHQSSTAPGGTATTGPPAQSRLSLRALSTFPVESYRVFETARQRLLADCMSMQGLEYVIPDVTPTTNLDALAELYPSDDLLEQYGYTWRMHSQAFVDQAPDPNEELRTDPTYDAAFNTCGADAAEVLDVVPLAAAFQVIEGGRQEIAAQVESDPRMIESMRRWADCMAVAGYGGFADPVDAMRSTTADPTSSEAIRLAQVDYSCQREVTLAETEESITTELSAAWIDDNPGAVEARDSALAALMAAADRVLAS